MNHFSSNLKYLRRQHDMTQEDLANALNIKRPVIGSYEEQRAEPGIDLLKKISRLFDITVDDLFNINLSNGALPKDSQKEAPKILSIVTDAKNKELITLVPVKASAGYLNGYADKEYIETLPVFSLPLPELKQDRTYRAFQIKGESMLPIKSGSYILAEYVENISNIKNDQTYIIVSLNDGVVFKRLNKDIPNKLKLISDNPDFEAYTILVSEIVEVWKAKAVISFNID